MKTKLIKLSILTIFTLLILNSCGLYKRSDIKDNPVNVEERVKRNIQEGRGFRFGQGASRGGDFDFASSNPLWRGAIDVMDFVPLTNASYSGGIIITEWFSSENNTENNNRELKLANLKKATLFEKDDFKKYKETKGKNKAKTVIKNK